MFTCWFSVNKLCFYNYLKKENNLVFLRCHGDETPKEVRLELKSFQRTLTLTQRFVWTSKLKKL